MRLLASCQAQDLSPLTIYPPANTALVFGDNSEILGCCLRPLLLSASELEGLNVISPSHSMFSKLHLLTTYSYILPLQPPYRHHGGYRIEGLNQDIKFVSRRELRKFVRLLEPTDFFQIAHRSTQCLDLDAISYSSLPVESIEVTNCRRTDNSVVEKMVTN